MPRIAAYFSSNVFPLNLTSNNLYSEYILTICFGYNMEQYFSTISEDVSDRLDHFTRYASTFWNRMIQNFIPQRSWYSYNKWN